MAEHASPPELVIHRGDASTAATRHTIYLGAWGLAAILAANIFIGGLLHWLTYLPGNKKPAPTANEPIDFIAFSATSS